MSEPLAAPGCATPPLISLKGLSRCHLTPAGTFMALDAVDLQIRRGEFLAVTGRSGSGKSTLTNLLAGIDRPTAGEIVVDGQSLGELDERALTRWRGRAVGVIFQFFQLLPTLTVLENVMLPMDFARRGTAAGRRHRARALLERVGIEGQADKFPAALSGGQQQRAAIARALANDPPLLVADEPTGNLDSTTAAEVMALFSELAGGGRTVVMVTHERDVGRFATRLVTLADGRLTAPPERVPMAREDLG